MNKKISVIVPAYNEEKTIAGVLKRIRGVSVPGFTLEVIVVNDGSRDRTAEVVEKNSDLYDLFVNLKENRGKGGAVKAGLQVATGEYILFQDADLEYDPNDFSKLFVPIQKWNADVVFGSRVMNPEVVRVHYLWNYVGNRALTWFFNLLYNRTFSDVYTCYLMYRRGLVNPDTLKTVGFEQQAEIICRCLEHQPTIYEVPISYHGRTHEEGKKIKAYHAFSCFWTIMKCRFFHSPKKNLSAGHLTQENGVGRAKSAA